MGENVHFQNVSAHGDKALGQIRDMISLGSALI